MAPLPLPKEMDTLNLALGLIAARKQKFSQIATKVGDIIDGKVVDADHMIKQTRFFEDMEEYWTELGSRSQEELSVISEEFYGEGPCTETEEMSEAMSKSQTAMTSVESCPWINKRFATKLRTMFPLENHYLSMWDWCWSFDLRSDYSNFIAHGTTRSSWTFGERMIPLEQGHPDWFVVPYDGGVAAGTDIERILPQHRLETDEIRFLKHYTTPLMLVLAWTQEQSAAENLPYYVTLVLRLEYALESGIGQGPVGISLITDAEAVLEKIQSAMLALYHARPATRKRKASGIRLAADMSALQKQNEKLKKSLSMESARASFDETDLQPRLARMDETLERIRQAHADVLEELVKKSISGAGNASTGHGTGNSTGLITDGSTDDSTDDSTYEQGNEQDACQENRTHVLSQKDKELIDRHFQLQCESMKSQLMASSNKFTGRDNLHHVASQSGSRIKRQKRRWEFL